MRTLTRQPQTEAQFFFAQERRVRLWTALVPLLLVVNLTAVTLSLLAQ